ncbi:MAG: SDR family oxidoreductase [Planctomycetales bacterium]|nr:SDR family oxidoreductase [Planctomycetales bacterium]MCA9220984.1 SDR family oxidoreductase [Planctomycetales bacterium]
MSSTTALAGKTIVIIGGTGGMGFSAAKACAAAGANLVIVGRDAKRSESARIVIGDRCRAVAGDAADPQTAERAIAAAVDAFGRLDGLYHVAGGSGRRFGDGPLDKITDEGWQTTLHWNLDSLFYSNRAAVRQMLAQASGGVILNMASVLAFSPSPGHFATHAYATSKAAVVGFTKSTAAYYAQQNIRINVIAPALVETSMAGRAANDPAIMHYVASKQPLDGGRIGQPRDLDGAAVFLLSDQARWITGQTLIVDGGWSVTEGQYRSPAE